MRIVRTLAELPGAIEQRPRRGGVGVRRRDGVLRAVRRGRAARRGAGPRPTPTARCGRSASGTARCSAGTRRWSRRRRRPWCDDAAARRAVGRRRRPPPRRSTTSAPAPWSSSYDPDDRHVLLPRDEHPAAGRAPGHRVRHRPRPGRAAARGRRGRRRWPASPPQPRGARDRGPALRRGPGAGLAADRRHGATGSPSPACARSSTSSTGRASGWTPASSTATRSARHYDPMLAKVIAWAPTRAEAAAPAGRGAGAARRCTALATNRDLLVRTLRHQEFLAGRTDTGFFDRIGLDALAAPLAGPDRVELAVLAAALASARARPAACAAGAGRAAERVAERPVPAAARPRSRSAARPVEVGYRHARGGLRVEGRDDVRPGRPRRRTRSSSRSPASSAGSRASGTDGPTSCVDGDGSGGGAARAAAVPDAADAVAEGSLVAPMPGTVVRPCTWRSATPSRAGQPLLVLEAMKMQHPVARAGGRRGALPGRRRRGSRWTPAPCSRRESREERMTLELRRGRRAAGAARGGGRPRLPATGSDYFLEQARTGGRTDRAVGRGGQGRLPRRQPARGVRRRGRRHGRAVASCCEELGAAGCPLLMMVVSPAICGTVIGRFGTDEQKQRWLPGLADGSTHHGVRDHRARRRLQLPRDHHGGPAGRRRAGCCRAGRSGSAASTRPTRCSSSAGSPTDAARARCGRRCSSSRPTPRADRAPDPDGDRQPGEAVPAVPRRRPAARRRPRRPPGPGHRAAVRRAQPGAGDGRGVLASGVARLAMRKATDYARERDGLGHADRRPPGAGAPAGGLPDRDRAGPADDAEGRLADRRARRTPAPRPTAPSTPRPRPPRTPSTRRSRPTAATACRRSTASPRCWRCPAPSRIAPVSREMILSFVAQHDLQLPRSY